MSRCSPRKLIARVEAIVREEGSDAWYLRPATDFSAGRDGLPGLRGVRFRQRDGYLRCLVRFRLQPHVGTGGTRGSPLRPPTSIWRGRTSIAGGSRCRCSPISPWDGRRRRIAARCRTVSCSTTPGATERNRWARSSTRRRWWSNTARISCACGSISADMRADMAMSEEAFAQVMEVYRRIRNTARFLLGNLYDFTPDIATAAGGTGGDRPLGIAAAQCVGGAGHGSARAV